jgi:hypothetical protein
MQYAPSLPIAGQGVTLWYGSIAASADSTGKSWQFGDMQGNAGAGASSFTGTCSTSNGQSSISISGQPTLLNAQWPGGVGMTAPSASTQSTIWIGPSGFFVADQSDPTASPASGGSVAGVIEPSSPLNTSDVESHNYLGMLYQAATAGGGPGGGTGVTAAAPTQTSLVAFGPPEVGSGPGLQGGSYPNDDLTMAPGTDIVVNLGKEDSIYNGLYSSVSITVLDPAQNCANYTGPGETATSGINAQGYVTCTFPGIAVAGIPEGKYTIFVSAYNWAAVLGGAPMQIYLIQQ